MSAELLTLLAAVAAWQGVRWWWLRSRVSYHTRARDRHDSIAWRLMRGGR